MKVEIIMQKLEKNLFQIENKSSEFIEDVRARFHKFIGVQGTSSRNHPSTSSGNSGSPDNASVSVNATDPINAGNVVDSADSDERGDVPGWVLVVLMTTGLVTAIWTIAAPRLSAILKNSLDAMNGIR